VKILLRRSNLRTVGLVIPFALALLGNTVPSVFIKQQVVSSCALKHFIIDEDYSRPS
jgi:hypothetical protein